MGDHLYRASGFRDNEALTLGLQIAQSTSYVYTLGLQTTMISMLDPPMRLRTYLSWLLEPETSYIG